MRTHYDNLQVVQNASPSVIKNAYRALAQEWHPDKRPDNTEEATRKLKIINQAYKILSNPAKRKKHDEWIAEQERIAEQECVDIDSGTRLLDEPALDPGTLVSGHVIRFVLRKEGLGDTSLDRDQQLLQDRAGEA